MLALELFFRTIFSGNHTEILLISPLSSVSKPFALHANAPRSTADSEGSHMMSLVSVYFFPVSFNVKSQSYCRLNRVKSPLRRRESNIASWLLKLVMPQGQVGELLYLECRGRLS